MRVLGILLVLAFALLLAGCAGLEVKPASNGLGMPEVHRHVPDAEQQALARAKPCCVSLAELPYRTLDREGPISLDIGPDSPAFDFDTGKSYFVAFRLPDWPRPLEIHLRSRAAPPMLMYMDSNRPIFSPALLVLDAQFRVKRVIHEPAGLTLKRYGPGSGGPEVQVEGEVYIAEPPHDASYLVILTTDELRARTVMSAGVSIEGFRPGGTVELAVRSVPFAALPVRYRGPAMLVDTQRDGALSGALFWRSNTLLISANGVHYLEEKDGRYVERLTVPFANIVAARVNVPFLTDARLELDVARRPGDLTMHHTIVLVPAREETNYDLRRVASIATEGTPPGWYRETLAVKAASSAPVVEFREPPPVPSGVGGRVADSAMASGVVTAGVCGICQTGLCPPEVLLPCAGLFAIGAAVGGAVGVGGELLSGGFKPGPQPPALPAQQVHAATPAVSSAVGVFMAQDALRTCVLRRASGADPWVFQGRAAAFEQRPEVARFVVETAVHRVALVSKGRPGQPVAKIPVQLVVEGGLIFHDTARQREEPRPATWQGPSHTLAEWSAPDGQLLEAAMREACDGLAASILRRVEPLWRDAR